MDTPSVPTGPGPAAERPNVVLPDTMKAAGVPEQVAPGPEAAPGGPGGPANGSAAPTPQPKLTAADVAAAIAAVPFPGPAPATAGTPVPGTAADQDLIEPEWVAKAEEVVAQHAGDPYGEEEAVEDLQQDYLQKRYGMKVADPDQQKPAK